MPDEMHLKHMGEYGKPFALAKKGAVFFGLLFFVMLLLQNAFSSFSGWLIAGSILSGIMLMDDLAVIIVYGAKLKTVGEYEKIDIIDNRIRYSSQIQGEAIFQPRNILKIALVKKPHGGIAEAVIHFNNSTEVFLVPKTVSRYAELVGKIEKFASDNSIPLEEQTQK